MMMKKTLHALAALALLACLTAGSAWAGPAGFDFSGAVGAWFVTPGGKAETLDLDSDLGLDTKANLDLWLRLEHPVPLLPDVKVEYAPLKLDGGRASSEVDLKLLDVTAYWHAPFLRAATSDVLDVTFGVGARSYDAELKFSHQGQTRGVDADKILPMLYAGARIQPVRYFALVGELRGYSWNDDKTSDAMVKVEIFPFGDYLFMGAGYRYMTLQNADGSRHDDELNMDIKQGGFFMEVGFDI